jgi:hypothetical protein
MPEPVSRYIVSSDKSLLDIDAIYAFLSTCYWSSGIARERVVRGIENGLAQDFRTVVNERQTVAASAWAGDW